MNVRTGCKLRPAGGIQMNEGKKVKCNYFNDAPINSPEEDRFGIAPFARAIAQSIEQLDSPVGTTIALNGPWGSGKTCAVNLIRHYLGLAVDKEHLIIVDFKCWWFRGEEALTLAFLQELNTAIAKSLGDKVKGLIPKLGKKLLRAGPIVGAATNIASGGFLGGLFSGSMDFAKEFFPDGEGVETVFNELYTALEKQEKRFLLIIDDIDRLTPDEALMVFRLVKSVGRLPNVMYLLAFDRELAEKAVKDRYPSEGPHFLEKIIQASFEVPLPARDDLNEAILSEVEECCKVPQDQARLKRFMNVFYDIVAPLITIPRHVVRLRNVMMVSWPPIANEVDVADYVALETLRLIEPKLYNEIRTNKERLCGLRSQFHHKNNMEQELQNFVGLTTTPNREHVKIGLMRLFPRLEDIGYGESFLASWEAERRICTEQHFDAYFRMALSDDALATSEVNEFIQNCGDTEFIRKGLINARHTIRKNGKSKVPLILDELNVHAPRIEKEKFEPFISALFEVVDKIYRKEDSEKGFSIGNTYLRVHWLIRKLLLERTDLAERTEIFLKACKNAALGWLVDFTSSAIKDYQSDEGKTPEPLEKCLVTEDRLVELKRHTIESIEEAATTGELIVHHRLAYILYRWLEMSDDEGASIKKWTDDQLSQDTNVAELARAFTGESWSQGMDGFLGDRVAMRQTTVGIDSLEKIMDVKKFRIKLEELEENQTLKSPYMGYVNEFLDAWKEKDNPPKRRDK